MKQEDRKKLEANGDFKVYKEKQVYKHSNDKKYWSNNGQDKILTAGDVISRLKQLPSDTVILVDDSTGIVGTLPANVPFYVREAPDGTIAVEI